MTAKEYNSGIYRPKTKCFVQKLYFSHASKMVLTADENRHPNLPKKSGQQASHFHNSKFICPKIIKFHQRIENSILYNFGIIHICIRGQQDGLK